MGFDSELQCGITTATIARPSGRRHRRPSPNPTRSPLMLVYESESKPLAEAEIWVHCWSNSEAHHQGGSGVGLAARRPQRPSQLPLSPSPPCPTVKSTLLARAESESRAAGANASYAVATSGALVHPNSYMNSWNIWIHTWKNHMNSYLKWQVNSCTEYEFIYEMIIWIHEYINSYLWIQIYSLWIYIWIHKYMYSYIWIHSI